MEAILFDLMWLLLVLGLTIIALIYVRLLGNGDREKRP